MEYDQEHAVFLSKKLGPSRLGLLGNKHHVGDGIEKHDELPMHHDLRCGLR